MQSNLRRRMLMVKIAISLVLAPLLAWGAYHLHAVSSQSALADGVFDRTAFLIVLVPLLVYIVVEVLVSSWLTRWESKRLQEFADQVRHGCSSEAVDFPELQPIVNAFRYKERQLQQEAMKINWIIRHIPGGLLIVNNQQEILFAVCPPFEDLGIPLDDLVGQSLRVFEERIGVKREGSALMDALQKGIKSRRISKVRDRYFEAVSTPMVNAEGQIDGAVCLFVDVSERVHQEQEMKRLEKLRLVGQMAASLSHEIRNPLTVIRGYLQLYSKRPHHEPAQGQFQLLLGEIDRVSEIVQQFLGLTRDRGEDMQPRSLTEVVEQVAPLVNSEASFSGIKLQLCLEETPPIPLCDSDIKQLLLNLYRNAVEACQPGGHVQLTTGTDENGRPYLRVQDDGCGMPSHVLAHLGTPFQSTKENGTGLGLPLCLGIAQAHGAELSFDSAPDHGTIVTVLFPKPKHARRADASDN